MGLPALRLSGVESWLAAHHGAAVSALEQLPSGYWSAAFGYVVDGRELVLRVGTQPDGFAMDKRAHAFACPGLPIPEVLEIGEAFGFAYAISTRSRGRFLESLAPAEAPAARPAVVRLLDALRAVPAPPDAPASWYGPPGKDPSWRGWLAESLVDDPRLTVSGWRATIALDPDLDHLYRATERRVLDLLAACPERRDLVHGDLLNRNVLVSDDASEVNAVFSWKCSVRGDSLYESRGARSGRPGTPA